MKREKGLDFVRALSIIGIVAFHFYVHSSSEHKLFLMHANGAWGGTLNYLFFALSGLVLHLKYGSLDTLSLKSFYYKRWKSTMPAYLLVFSVAFLRHAIQAGRFFYLPIPKYRLLFTLFGMDSYINMVTPTYFITGEWFLGAILLLYLVYPILRFLINHYKYLTLVALVLLYVYMLNTDFFGMLVNVNPATCMLSFYLGMLMASDSRFLNKPIWVIGAALCCSILIKVPIGVPHITKEILVGVSLLITLNFIGKYVCRSNHIYRLISVICDFGYYTFLIYHRLMLNILPHFDPTNTGSALLLLIAIILVTQFFALILDKIMKQLLHSSVFLKIEQKILGRT